MNVDFHLHPDHLADLRASGLSDETIFLMGVRSVRPADISRLATGGLQGVESVLEFPYGAEFSRFKLFPPLRTRNGHSLRYFQKSGTGCHLYVLAPVRRVLSDPRVPLYLTEGEKKAAAAIQAGLACVGLGGLWNFIDGDTGQGIRELSEIAWVDRPAVLVPDSDIWTREDLQRAVFALAKDLEGRGSKVEIVILPPADGEVKVGLDDFLLGSGLEAFEKTARITLRHPAMRRHEVWWKNWKIKKRGEHESQQPGLQGRVLSLSDPEPWSDPVDGADLVRDIVAILQRFVVLRAPEAYTAEALWVVHAHAIEASDISPYLACTSPEMRCGKTTNARAISRLVPRPLFTSTVTPAAIFRTVEKFKPTLLVDEADTFASVAFELRELLNASHHREEALVIRCVGDEHEPRAFSTWCPKVVALIGALPPTLSDRSIIIPMSRKKQSERTQRLSRENAAEFEILCRKIARWAKDHLSELRQADPALPDSLDDRAQDNWRPLLAVAEAVGGPWPENARKAAQALSKVRGEDDTLRVKLLADIRAVFDDSGSEALASTDLVERLTNVADRLWAEFKAGKPLTQVQLARLLKPFEIRPAQVWLDGTNVRGYRLDWFAEAFDRYLPSEVLDPLDPAPGALESDICEPLDGDQPSGCENARNPALEAGPSTSSGSEEGWEDIDHS